MNSSLREEISPIINHRTKWTTEEKVNEVLSMIEKRIDSLADSEWFDNVHDANMFRQAMDKVKEMLLK